MQTLFWMDSRKIQQDKLVLGPAEIASGLQVVFPEITCQTKRDRCQWGFEMKMPQVLLFNLACSKYCGGALKKTAFNEQKIRPLFPPPMSPSPRLEHPVRRYN